MTVNHTELNILPRESHGKVTEDLNSCEGGKILAVYQNTSGGIYGSRLSAVNQNISGSIYGGRLLAVNQNISFYGKISMGIVTAWRYFFSSGVNKCIAKVPGFVRICSVMMVYVLSTKKTIHKQYLVAFKVACI